MADDSGSGSNLDRYLNQKKAESGGVQVTPAALPNLNLATSNEGKYEPAGFWRRWVAALIDAVVLSLLKIIIQIPATVLFRILFADASKAGHLSSLGTAVSAVFSLVVYCTITYYYYGHFYQTKGATPGKSLMDLKVIGVKTGTYIEPWLAFKREVFGKLASILTLGIGFLMAGFRKDKRALHDILCDTRVVHLKTLG